MEILSRPDIWSFFVILAIIIAIILVRYRRGPEDGMMQQPGDIDQVERTIATNRNRYKHIDDDFLT